METITALEIYALAAWLQAMVFSTCHDPNAADLRTWWAVAFVLTIQSFAFDFFILSSYYQRRLFSDHIDRRCFLILQFIITSLVGFQAGILYSLTLPDLVNCPLNSYVVIPFFGFAFNKFRSLDVLSFIVLAIRLSRVFQVSRLHAGFIDDDEEEEEEEYVIYCEKEDGLTVLLLDMV